MSTHQRSGTAGRLYGVGVGPGDPDLLTVKAVRVIGEADVVAYHAGTGRDSIARSVVASLLRPGVVEEQLSYPVTTGEIEHPGGYYGALEDFYAECTQRLAAHLEAGRQVVVLAEGDPLFYGSFMYLHDRLADRFATEIIPGVTALAGATAAAAMPLARHEDVLTVLPGTLSVPELARRIADTDAAVIMKLGRNFEGVREALRQAGKLDRAVYVERATRASQRVVPVDQVLADSVPYMSVIVVPGLDRRADLRGRAGEPVVATRSGKAGTVFVVGLGPGPEEWMTPQAREVLASVSHVVGYAPYVARVPQRTGLQRHASGNTVEVERARFALDLALAGDDVAVVSGGDAGVFGMASAVFEAWDVACDTTGGVQSAYAALQVQVVPGVSAAQAAAALAGAPLGADFAVISLSDRLKPWSVLEERLQAAAASDLAIALYNPRSNARPHQLEAAKQVLLSVKGPETVVLVAREVGRPAQSLEVSTLGDFDPETVDMRCLVIIGSSTTRVTRDGRVWTPRFVNG